MYIQWLIARWKAINDLFEVDSSRIICSNNETKDYWTTKEHSFWWRKKLMN